MHPERQWRAFKRDREQDSARIEFWVREQATWIVWELTRPGGVRSPFLLPVLCSSRNRGYICPPPDRLPYAPSRLETIRVEPIGELSGQAGQLIVETLIRRALEDVAP